MKSYKKIILLIIIIFVLIPFTYIYSQSTLSYPIVDTDQEIFYDTIIEITALAVGKPFYGQDAQYTRNAPSYQDNGDGTVTDLMVKY